MEETPMAEIGGAPVAVAPDETIDVLTVLVSWI
jgi:hypothetical protein